MSSTWQIKDKKEFPKLRENLDTDVVVIGGGLAGMWAAYSLAQLGKRVVLLEKDKVGSGYTEYTTAFLMMGIDTSLMELKSIYGEATAKLVWQSHKEAIDRIEEVAERENIECEFMRLSSHTYASNSRDFKELVEEHKLAEKLGFDTHLLSHGDLPFPNMGSLELVNQAKYHPIKFLYGLRDAAEKLGVRFYESTEAIAIVGNAPVSVTTKEGQMVTADQVVVATYEPFDNPKATHFKKGMYVSYVIEFEIARGKIDEGLYLDMHNPYHYVRVDDLGDKLRMIVGGEDHRKEIPLEPEKSYKALYKYVYETFPGIEYKEVRRWSGGILEPSDGLALIGRVSGSELVAAAFSGNGMTYSAITGTLIADIIQGRPNPYDRLYDPRRKLTLKSLAYKARDYAGEFFGGAARNLFN